MSISNKIHNILYENEKVKPIEIKDKYHVVELLTEVKDLITDKEKNNNNTSDVSLDTTNHCKKLLNDWQKFCTTSIKLHDMCRAYYRVNGNNIIILAISLSTIGGASNMASKSEFAHITWLPILFGGISLASGALMSIYRFMNFQELEKSHHFYSGEYTKLKNEIDMQLNIHGALSKIYFNLTEFCKKCKTDLDSLLDREPPILKHILIDFEKQNENRKKQAFVHYLPSSIVNSPYFNKNRMTSINNHRSVLT